MAELKGEEITMRKGIIHGVSSGRLAGSRCSSLAACGGNAYRDTSSADSGSYQGSRCCSNDCPRGRSDDCPSRCRADRYQSRGCR